MYIYIYAINKYMVYMQYIYRIYIWYGIYIYIYIYNRMCDTTGFTCLFSFRVRNVTNIKT